MKVQSSEHLLVHSNAVFSASLLKGGVLASLVTKVAAVQPLNGNDTDLLKYKY